MQAFTEQMGRGTYVSKEPSGKWIYPTPNSISEIILKRVCEKVK